MLPPLLCTISKGSPAPYTSEYKLTPSRMYVLPAEGFDPYFTAAGGAAFAGCAAILPLRSKAQAVDARALLSIGFLRFVVLPNSPGPSAAADRESVPISERYATLMTSPFGSMPRKTLGWKDDWSSSQAQPSMCVPRISAPVPNVYLRNVRRSIVRQDTPSFITPLMPSPPPPP